MQDIAFRWMRRVLCLTVCVLAAGLNTFAAFAGQDGTEQIPAKLTCGSHSSNPTEKKAFQVELQFNVTGSLWQVDWKAPDQSREIKFRGIQSHPE